MSDIQHASVHQENNSSGDQIFNKPSRNPTWRREPVARDRSTAHLVPIDPTASPIVADPAGPHVYPPHLYGGYGMPYFGGGAYGYHSYGYGTQYPPTYGSRDHYQPYRTSRAHYTPHGDGSGASKAPGHASYSHVLAARDLPFQSSGAHSFPSDGVGTKAVSLTFPAVSLRGLPVYCREADIIQFFDGLHIVDVFLIFINKIFSGEAFVVFSNPTEADKALQRNKQKLGRSSVEISTCSRQVYYDAIAAKLNDGVDLGNPRSHEAQKTRHVLKVSGPSCFSDKTVIIGVFSECNLSEDRVHNVINPDGSPTVEILLEFISEEDAKKAMSKNKTMVGSHLIEIIPSSPEDLPNTNTKHGIESDSRHRVKDSNNKEFKGPDSHSHSRSKISNDKKQRLDSKMLKLCNVPPSADMYDIIEFFGGFNLTLDRLKVVCRQDGIATGEVYVEFDSVVDAKKAISTDKKMILSQLVELFPSSSSEARQAVSRYL